MRIWFSGVDFIMDEVYLVSRSKNGDKSAFAALVDMYQNKLYRTACCIIGNSDDAYDALQDCVLKAYISIGALRNDYYFKYWINRILINSCNDIIRHRKKVIYIDDTEFMEETDSYDVAGLDVRMAMDKLDSKYKLILSLRFYQDLSYEDIAETLNCPVGTVKSRLNYALRKLRDSMDKTGSKEVGR